MSKNIFCIILCFIFIGCANNKAIQDELILPNQDLRNYENNSFSIDSSTSMALKEHFLKVFFSAWNNKKYKIYTDYTNTYLENPGFGENNQPNSKEFINDLIIQANFNNARAVNKNAIVINSSDVRLLPTNKPRFYNPLKAGEGFPFDYLQNSYIYAYTPIKISHFSLNLDWAFIESSSFSGFVKSKDIAIISDEDIKTLKNAKDYISPKKDKIPLIKDNEFIEYARVGMIFAVSSEDELHYEIIAFKKDSFAKMIKIKVLKNDFFKLGDSFSSTDIAKVANYLIGEKYGWGGYFGNRDCSALLKDIFANFGVFLERNSQSQIRQKDYLKNDNFVDLSKLNAKEKINYIKTNAIAFGTLLALKGHIVLYIGEFNDELLILHDLWGIKTYVNNEEGRLVLGKVVITPIDVGKNLSNVKEEDIILNKIYGMRNLFWLLRK